MQQESEHPEYDFRIKHCLLSGVKKETLTTFAQLTKDNMVVISLFSLSENLENIRNYIHYSIEMLMKIFKKSQVCCLLSQT